MAPPYFVRCRGQTTVARWRLSHGEDPTEALADGWRFAETGLEIGSDPTGLVLSSWIHLVDARWRIETARPPETALGQTRQLIGQVLTRSPETVAAREAADELGRLESVSRGS